MPKNSFSDVMARWLIYRDEFGAQIFPEGSHEKEMFNNMQQTFWEPAFKRLDQDGNLFFVYIKAQCGLTVSCDLESASLLNLHAPLTEISLRQKSGRQGEKQN
ncbi:MAG: hypothetical protein HY043_18475 [Verrucomicrobia bacterium]|nr:hypothetical protein [Verrucomicrobiota bacterium]